jgi:K+-sensing histidine kinase KdpD
MYKQLLFATLLGMILVPTATGLICSLYAGWLWNAEYSAMNENQQLTANVQSEGDAFCNLISYSYAVLSSAFEQQSWKRQAAFMRKKDAERELTKLAYLFENRHDANSSRIEDLSSSILNLKSRVDSLQNKIVGKQFNDNLSRFSSVAVVVRQGRILSQNLEELFESVEKQQRTQLIHHKTRRTFVMTCIYLVSILSSICSLLLFSRFTKRIHKDLNLVKSNFLQFKSPENFVEPEAEVEVDEIGYVNKVFCEIARQVVKACAEQKFFIQMLAHDLRSPLMSFQISMDMFVEAASDKLTMSQIQACDRIEGLTETLSNLITNLLLFDSLKSDEVGLVCSEFNFLELTNEALAKTWKQAIAKAIRAENNCSTKVLTADRSLILRVMQIWIQWSIERAPKGSTIRLQSSENNGQHNWSIINCGAELAPEKKRDLFAGFDAHNKVHDRGSLYFALTRLILKAHGGAAQITSQPSGTELRFTIGSTRKFQTCVPSDRNILPADLFVEKSKPLSLGLKGQGVLLAVTPAFFQCLTLLFLTSQLNQFSRLEDAVSAHRESVAKINTLWLKAYQANSYVSTYLATGSADQKTKAINSVNALHLTLNEFPSGTSSEDANSAAGTMNKFVEEELHYLIPLFNEATTTPTGDPLSRIPRILSLAEPLHEKIKHRLELETQDLILAQGALMKAWRVAGVGFIFVATLNVLWLVGLAVYFRAKMMQSLRTIVANARIIGRGRTLEPLREGSEELGELNELLIAAALVLEKATDENRWISSVLAEEIWCALNQSICDLVILNEFIKKEPGFREADRELLQQAEATALKLTDLVQELFSLMDSSLGERQMIKLTKANLRDFIRETVDTVAYLSLAKNLTIQIVAPSETVLIDSGRMGQVLMNILCNAIKFAPPDTSIFVSAQLQDTQILFEVADQGPGISEDRRLRVFDRYFKSEQGSASAFGLGLSICKALVCAHNGQIDLHANDSGGTTFVITIPRTPFQIFPA